MSFGVTKLSWLGVALLLARSGLLAATLVHTAALDSWIKPDSAGRISVGIEARWHGLTPLELTEMPGQRKGSPSSDEIIWFAVTQRGLRTGPFLKQLPVLPERRKTEFNSHWDLAAEDEGADEEDLEDRVAQVLLRGVGTLFQSGGKEQPPESIIHGRSPYLEQARYGNHRLMSEGAVTSLKVSVRRSLGPHIKLTRRF